MQAARWLRDWKLVVLLQPVTVAAVAMLAQSLRQTQMQRLQRGCPAAA